MEHEEDTKPEQVPEANEIEQDNSDDEDFKKLEEDSTQPKKRLMPKKADYRMRAHINPLSDTPFPYPLNPDYVNWRIHYPLFFGGGNEENELVYTNTNEHPITFPEPADEIANGRKSEKVVEFVDVGCGFGGLTIALGEHFPDKLSFGMEIRDKLCNYVGEKIKALRIENPGKYGNIAVSRTNAMRHLSNYFRKGQLEKLFFCFADPHFKKSNHRRRIIGTGFLTEYAYLLKKGGRIYSITDVLELHEWNDLHLSKNKLFRKLTPEELEKDICVQLIRDETEEGKKVARNNGSKYTAVYEKL